MYIFSDLFWNILVSAIFGSLNLKLPNYLHYWMIGGSNKPWSEITRQDDPSLPTHTHFTALCVYKRPILVPVFVNWKKTEEAFHFTTQEEMWKWLSVFALQQASPPWTTLSINPPQLWTVCEYKVVVFVEVNDDASEVLAPHELTDDELMHFQEQRKWMQWQMTWKWIVQELNVKHMHMTDSDAMVAEKHNLILKGHIGLGQVCRISWVPSNKRTT